MATNINPPLVTPILENVRFSSPELVTAGAGAIRDETGNRIRDEEGHYIDGE
jgi:hypothetical protein